MLVYENDSIDNTRQIIQNLIDEGLPIYFLDDIKLQVQAHGGLQAYKLIIEKAINEFDADLIVRLDADEFLYHVDGINPRDMLEELEDDAGYLVPWRSYVYKQEPLNNNEFLPNNFTSYRNPAVGEYTKALLSKYLLNEKCATFTAAGHSLSFPDETRASVRLETTTKLVLCHYPLRNKSQLMTKVIPTWILHYKKPFPTWEGQAFQYKLIYDDLAKSGELSHDIIKKHSLIYGFQEGHFDNIHPQTIDESMNVLWCNDKLTLRYTNYENVHKTFLKELLYAIESTLFLVPEREQKTIEMLCDSQRLHNEITARYYELTNGYNNLTLQNDELIKKQNELVQKNREQALLIDEIYNSNTWKFGKKVQQIYRKFVPFKF